MTFSLSWQQKFRVLIALTLISLSLMAAASFWANQRLSASLQARESASNYAGSSTLLLNQWWRTHALRQQLSPSNLPEFNQNLGELEELVVRLVTQAESLNDPALSEHARQIQAFLQQDVTQQRAWSSLNQTLGLTPFDGQRKVLGESASALEKITIGLIQPAISRALSSQRDYLSTYDPTFAQNALSAIAEMQAKVAELDWQDTPIGQSVAAFTEAFAQAQQTIVRIEEANRSLAQVGQQLQTQVDTQASDLESGLLVRTEQAAQQAQRSALWIMGLSFCAVAGLLTLTLLNASRTLVARLQQATQLLSQVASGNLTGTLPVGRNPNDEFNQLATATNRMIQGIGGIVAQVVQANQALSHLHHHLGDAMHALGDNSTQVEQQTEQAASASQQISLTLNDMAQRTADVGSATQSAYAAARDGGVVIQASVERMAQLAQLIQASHAQADELGQTSTRVSGIIDVINSLADQTNLLALNAAIEAARAGDAGRGFSVVADEVRSLAQKTVAATTDIAAIVAQFQQQARQMRELMGNGLSLAADSEQHAAQVATAINAITQAMERLTGEMNQVVVAIEEVSTTTDDIAGKMDTINLHTGQSKDLRHTLGQHTEGLSVQVDALSRSAQRFQLG
ncbi:MAG: methyl-accepting chemotaxis protein [Gammaproteobacteria bacterium]|nr:methyl-accepting chemotaxis protein [Gammaproteobacteria bacterium]MBU1491295.1 methyl-accepting chemotaxis protein [Gammaproteobacteria bacterium]MBU2067886.1 methyl-accepting chemotaxis protein [Gammaproteobacteria bacterium]MBU2138385.1 methyl-accepting chemotaxis protein [Gammaproteobacteria bacterium]MBU2218354.1 methyl-accepting chemotaxis protein [Gammaproteobacteria bacterium]